MIGMADDAVALEEDIPVGNGIFDRVRLLSSASKEEFRPQEGVANKVIAEAKSLESKNSESPLIWTINDNLAVVCEATVTRTDSVSKKNNIEQLAEYINKQYGENYLVISFRRTSITKGFKKCVAFPDIKFNLKDACKISKIGKFLMEAGERHVLIIEMINKKESMILLILACVLVCCRGFWSAESALNFLLASNPLKFQFRNTAAALRYARYHDQMSSFNTTLRFPQRILNQIIITTIPTMLESGSYVPKLKISTPLSTVTAAPEKCYIDKDYIIFSNLNQHIFEDVVISLLFAQKDETYHIFDLSLNTFFYGQGLHRFTRADIETSLPQESIYNFFDENFYVDLVVVENAEIQSPFTLPTVYDLDDVVKLICDQFLGDEGDKEYYQKLVDLGYNQHLSKACSLVGLNDDECRKLYQPFTDRLGALKLRNEIGPENEKDGDCTVELVNAGLELETDYRKIYQEIVEIEITPIALIEHTSSAPLFGRKVTSRLFRAKDTPEMPISEAFRAFKPLHITALHSIENTIFSEIQNLKVDLDIGKFEAYFCLKAQDKVTEIPYQAPAQASKSLIDPKRLFLVSLYIKQLEMRRIDLDHVLEVIMETPEKLTHQDLANILKILPTSEERVVLLASPEDELSTTERAMVNLSRVPEIGLIVPILMFEAWFFEEIGKIEQAVKGYSSAISLLLTSGDLKILFRVLLDVTNLINYVYGAKRRYLKGFKIDSLQLFTSYTGKEGYSLFEYTAELLIKNGMRVRQFKKVIESIAKTKMEEIGTLRDKINGVVAKYTECVALFDRLEQYDKGNFGKLLAYACKRLKKTVEEYKCLEENVTLLKKKVGEDPTRPICDILESLHAFYLKLVETLERSARRR